MLSAVWLTTIVARRLNCICIRLRLLLLQSAGNCCLELVRERLASPWWSHMASATRPLVPGERQHGELGWARRPNAMSVSFDAIRTALDAIWRPIAALRLTRCRRRQNSTRITQQLGKHVGLYRRSASCSTLNWRPSASSMVRTCYLIQLQAIAAIRVKMELFSAFRLFYRCYLEIHRLKSEELVLSAQMLTRCWALDRVQTHASHSITFNWNIFALCEWPCDLDLLT